MDHRTIKILRKKKARVNKMHRRISKIHNNFLRDPYNSDTNDPMIEVDQTYKLTCKHVDFRSCMTDVKSQEALNSCVSFSVISILEYYYDKNFSEMFLHYKAKTLSKWHGGKGASPEDNVGLNFRCILSVLSNIGCCDESLWPHDIKKYHEYPSKEAHDNAILIAGCKYGRLDKKDMNRDMVLYKMKVLLESKIPLVCGFKMPVSIKSEKTRSSGILDFAWFTAVGHGVTIVGYDDDFVHCGNKGCFIFKNSWGKEWGDNGYGYMPYSYIMHYKCFDIWAIENDVMKNSSHITIQNNLK